MTLPLDIHAFVTETDLAGLTGLLNAARKAEITPEQALAQITWPGFEITRDRFVALRGGLLAATGWIYPQSAHRYFVEVVTHPQARRQGLGRALVERLVTEVGQRGGQQVTCALPAGDAAARAFAAACGFSPAGEVRFFNADAGCSFPAAEVPPGFRLDSIDHLGDLQIFVDACNRCYADMWGHSENLEPLTVDRVRGWQRRNPNILRPAGMFVLLSPEGLPVGVTRADREGEGSQELRVIDAPGVAPQYRSLGLQRALVLAAAGWLRQNGQGPYQIHTWGDSPAAVEIYQSLGFCLDESAHEIEFVRYLS